MTEQPEPATRPGDDELQAAFEEQLRRIRVEDVLVQTAVTLVNLAGRRMGLPGPEGEREERPDLGQARLAIDAARALVPLLPADSQGALRDALSQIQLAYARVARPGEGAPAGAGARGGGAGAPGEQPGAPAQPGAETDKATKEEAERAREERARARSKIWTPPGA
jgi:hypothetical protein